MKNRRFRNILIFLIFLVAGGGFSSLVQAFIRPCLSTGTAYEIDKGGYGVKHSEYDWALNDFKPKNSGPGKPKAAGRH